MPRPVELDSVEFASAMSGIIADLGLRESEHPWSAAPSLPLFIEPANGVLVRGVATVYVPQNDLESTKADLADRLQEHVIDISWQAIPECITGHPHPMRAALVDGRGVWTCPRAGAVVRPIGERA
jgi:hypothetical protein